MSEDPVQYRARPVEAEFEILSNEIFKLIARARKQGIEPTEVWLGGPEWTMYEAANKKAKENGGTSNAQSFAGLSVRRFLGNGVRVGVSFDSKG